MYYRWVQLDNTWSYFFCHLCCCYCCFFPCNENFKIYFRQLSILYNIVNCSCHAVHYIPLIDWFFNWTPFTYFTPLTSSKHQYILSNYILSLFVSIPRISEIIQHLSFWFILLEQGPQGSHVVWKASTLLQMAGFHSFLWLSLVFQLCPTLCDPMDCSPSGLPVHHQFPELTQTHVH